MLRPRGGSEEEVTPRMEAGTEGKPAGPWCHRSLLQPWVSLSARLPSSRPPVLQAAHCTGLFLTFCHFYHPQVPAQPAG